MLFTKYTFEVLYFAGFCFLFSGHYSKGVSRKDVACYVYRKTIKYFRVKMEVSRHPMKSISFVVKILNSLSNLTYFFKWLSEKAPPPPRPLHPPHAMCLWESTNTF